jgi:filamentous hemagglutinin family protein
MAFGAGLPQGATVVAGQASINSPSAGQMVINQTTKAAAINWQSFDIGAGDSVQFVQPGAASVALNRVVGADPSTIMGHLNANGQIFLVNPNGVLFAPGASVNVGGIVASSLGISDADFLSGNYHFSGGGHGAVVNQGSITAAHGGYVALIGQSVSNEGTIAAGGGAAALGAGATVDMTLADNALESFKVSAAAVDALVSNGGAIRVAGGQVILSGQAMNTLLQTVVNNTGVISADSAVDTGGTITLLGSGGAVQADGHISAASQRGAGGSVAISGSSVEVGAGAQILVSGASGGGSIVVGGDLHGGKLPLATRTAVDAGALLDASATVQGNGGSIQVVSDTSNAVSTTAVSGALKADGGSKGGDGGSIETSGSKLDTTGITVQAAAPKGEAGQWLLDPAMIEIGTNAGVMTGGTADGTTTFSSALTSYLPASTIDSVLNSGTNVTVQTVGLTNSGAFDIWVVSPIEKTAGGDATLTLQAANSVYVGAPISSISGALNVNLYAGNNGGALTGTGAVLLASDITTNGGNINFGTNETYDFTNSGVTQLAGGDVYVDSQLTTSDGGGSQTNQKVTLDTTSSTGSGGNVNIYGQTVIANPSGFEIDTQHTGSSASDGNVNFAGTVDSGNTFQLVSGSYTWDQAYDGAQSGTGANVGDTYLATPSTSLLNAVASFTANYNQAWLGAERLIASTVTGTPDPSDTTSMDNNWYWIAGPLGVVVNPDSPTGYGTAFFTQYGTTTQNGQGGTPINGAYTNWNPATSKPSSSLGTTGEPNNDNGTSMTPNGAREYVLQFVGTAGQWNDLPPSSTMSYVKETNLAAAPLIVNSGQGTITLAAGVGTNAPLESFNATGQLIDLPQNPTINTTEGTTIDGQTQVSNGSGGYTSTTLLTISATSGSSTYGSSTPGTLPITYTVQGQASSSTPPDGVGAASEAWSTTPGSTSDVGIYNATLSGATCDSCGYTIVYVNGSLTIDPATLTISGLTATSRTYNGTNSVALNGPAALSGLLNDDAGTVTGSLTGTVASPNVQLVGGVAQSQAVTTDLGFSLTSGNSSDYVLVQPSLTATISPKPVTVSGLSSVGHTYNGSTTVALAGTPSFSGLVSGQSLTIDNLSTGGVAASANAGVQSVAGQVQLADGTNGLASNYTLSAQPALGDVTISPAPVTVSGLTPVNYTYDGSTTVALTGTPSFSGVLSGQALTIGNLSTGGVATSANAGTQAVTGQVQLADGTNGAASNYVLSVQPTLADVTISPAPVTVSGLSPVDRAYDGSATVALAGTPVFTGLVDDQTLIIGNLSTGAVAANANAGTQAVSGQVQLADGTNGSASNYVLNVQPALADVIISPAPVTVSGLSTVNRTYDGSTAVALSGLPTFTGLVEGQSLTIGNLSTGGQAASANAGTQVVSGQVQLADGMDGLASNYTLSIQPTLADVTINPATVTVSGLSPVDRTYDGSATVALSGTPVFSGLVDGQTLTIGNLGTGAVAASANAGQQDVTGQVQLADGTNGAASNYVLSAQPTLADVTINPAPVTVSGLSPVDRTYDGSTAVALSGTPVFTGLVEGQSLTIGNLETGAVAASANAGQQDVTGQVQLADGTNGAASNYVLSVQPTLADVAISRAPVTVSGLSPVDRAYDGSTTVALSGTPIFSGLVDGQTLTIGNLGTGAVAANANAGQQEVTGQVQLADGTNGAASNYVLSAQPTLADVTISPAPVMVVGSTALPMTYGSSGQVVIVGAHLQGVLPGDEVTLVNNATLGTQTTGAAVPVSFQDSLIGPDADNYAIAQQPQGVTVSVLPSRQTVVAPVQDGVAAPAANSANTPSATVSTLSLPPLVVAGASPSQTSIAVVDGGVNAPGSALQTDGFWQSLSTTNPDQGRRALIAP